MRLWPIRVLLLLILLLAGGLTWIWVDQDGPLRNVTWTPPRPLPPEIKIPSAVEQAGAGSTSDFAQILARPLFAPDRRPPPPPAPPAPIPPPDPLANIQIQGIFSGAHAGIMARVDGKVRRIKIDEAVGPWTLKSVEGRDVIFGQGDETRKLRLEYARLAPPILQVTSPVAGSPPGQTPAYAGTPQNVQDEARDRLRRRNEARAARGLPLVTE